MWLSLTGERTNEQSCRTICKSTPLVVYASVESSGEPGARCHGNQVMILPAHLACLITSLSAISTSKQSTWNGVQSPDILTKVYPYYFSHVGVSNSRLLCYLIIIIVLCTVCTALLFSYSAIFIAASVRNKLIHSLLCTHRPLDAIECN